jgi:hypothetical protein
LAGAGAGAALVGLIKTMPETPWSAFMIYLCPAAGVLVSFVIHVANNWFDIQKKRSTVRAIREMRDTIAKDVNASAKHKKHVQNYLEQVEQLLLDSLCRDDAIKVIVSSE